MDYQKKFPLPKKESEYVLIQWERGYKNVEISFRDRIIQNLPNLSGIKNGLNFMDEDLGSLKLKFSENPKTLDLIIDGLHSKVNRSHPLKEVKKYATFFYVLFVLALLGSALEIFQVYDSIASNPPILMIVVSVYILIVSAYLLTAILIGFGKTWSFYIGFSVFCFTTLLVIFDTVSSSNFLPIINIGIRIYIIIRMIKIIPILNEANKHKKLGLINFNENILDN